MTWFSRERHLLPSPTTLVQSLGPSATTWSRNVILLTQSSHISDDGSYELQESFLVFQSCSVPPATMIIYPCSTLQVTSVLPTVGEQYMAYQPTTSLVSVSLCTTPHPQQHIPTPALSSAALGFRFCCHPQPMGYPPTEDMGGRGEAREQPCSGFCGPASSPRELQGLLDRGWCGLSKGTAEGRKLKSAWRGYTLAPLSS